MSSRRIFFMFDYSTVFGIGKRGAKEIWFFVIFSVNWKLVLLMNWLIKIKKFGRFFLKIFNYAGIGLQGNFVVKNYAEKMRV